MATIQEFNSAIRERNVRQDIIAGAGGFYSGFWFPHKDENAAVDGSRNFWISPEGYWEACGATLRADADKQVSGHLLNVYGVGYAAITAPTGRGNCVKFAGSSPIFTSAGEIKLYEPIDFAAIASVNDIVTPLVASIAPYRQLSKSLRSSVTIGMQQIAAAPQLIQPLTPTTGMAEMTGITTIRVTYNRPVTGGESNASAQSNSLNLTNSSVIIKFPSPPQTPYVDRRTAQDIFGSKIPSAWDTNDYWLVYAAPRNFTTFTTFHRVSGIKVWERRLQREEYLAADCTASQATVGGGFEITITLPGGTGANKVFGRYADDLYTQQEFNEMLIGKSARSGTLTGKVTAVTYPTNPTDANRDIIQIKIFSTTSWAGGISGGKLTNNLILEAGINGFSDTRLIELSWTDGDLTNDFAPIDNFPPIGQCDFVGVINNIVLLINTVGRVGGARTNIAVSRPGFYESYPPEGYISLPEEAVGIAQRADDGYIYVLSRQAIYELRFTGAEIGIVLRTITNSVGTASATSFAVVNQNIFTFTPNNRIVVVSPGGDVNYAVGEDVVEYIRTWNAERVSVAHDERRNAVVFAHGRELLVYFIDRGVWSAPIDLALYTPGVDIPVTDIRAAITHRGVVHLLSDFAEPAIRTGNASSIPLGLPFHAVLGGLLASNPAVSAGDKVLINWKNLSHVDENKWYEFTVTSVVPLTGSFLAFLSGSATDKFGNTLNINPSQPCTWQRVLQSDTSFLYWLDRSPYTTALANNVSDARLRLQWNALGNPILGKTIQRFQIVATFSPTIGISTYADFSHLSPVNTALLNNPNGRITDVTDVNFGIRRFYAFEIRFASAQREKFLALYVDSFYTGIRSNF